MLASMQHLRHGSVCLQRTLRLPSVRRAIARGPGSRLLCTASQENENAGKRLFLYSKDGCHLCDGLKENIEALLWRAQYMQTPLTGVNFEVRDITTKPEWWDAYSLTIPVLTIAEADGSAEVKVPRPSPRISADRLEVHIAKSFIEAEGNASSEHDRDAPGE